MRRPSSRSYSGVVRPSTTPKIQMNAATLMNSGTVTKKPATKLRRSHCMAGYIQPAATAASSADAQRDAIPGERREARSPDVVQERPDDQRRRDERHDEADGDLERRAPTPRSWRTSSRSCANAAAIVGIARKKDELGGRRRDRRRIAIPATIVPPERDTPGISASA